MGPAQTRWRERSGHVPLRLENMVQAIFKFFAAREFAWWPVRTRQDSPAKIGALTVDYSEPTQEEVDAANASCADVFAAGNWVSINRK
jgi:hypothetical protein